ncbi:MAG: hypothetical protein DYH15_13990 [Nitrosomonas sp. PRO4]|nr:hypothetical protein [Nitrosomonas sp. PRO4]
MPPRIEKSIARYLAKTLAPECGEVFKTLRNKRGGWIRIPDELELARKNSGLGDAYVLLYEAEPRIYFCLFKAIFQEDTAKHLEQFDVDLTAISEADKLTMLKDFDHDLSDETIYSEIEDAFSQMKMMPEAAKAEFEALPEEERIEGVQRVQLALAFFYATFFNSIALMVHGQKLTTLVPLAMQGDKKAFCKAVQVDRNLLTGHPYFQNTYARLQTGENPNFLCDILTHMNRPPIQGRIRFPALYALFSTLDLFGWLNDFTASEILDICDEAGLDRYQNRIEDENYLIKRRMEYRRKHKIGF